MKTLIACLLVTTAASAGTINLPLPTIAQIAPTIPVSMCSWVTISKPNAIATGFSADGNYVLGTANDVALCGHSGRGSTIRAYPYCASFVWDLAGNLVSTTLGVCPKGDPLTVYSNAGGYEEDTYRSLYYGYLVSEYPQLVTP